MSATPASAVTADLTIPMPKSGSVPYISAASGKSALVDNWDGTTGVTTDNGKTWATAAIDGFGGRTIDYIADGHVYYDSEDSPNITRYDFATNTSTVVGSVSLSPDVINATTALTKTYDASDMINGFVITDVATSTQHQVPYTEHRISGDSSTEVALSGGSHVLVSTHSWTDYGSGTGYLDLLALDGSTKLTAKVSGLEGAQLRGDQVVYLSVTKSNISVCFRSAATWTTPTCKVVKKGDFRPVAIEDAVGDDWMTVTVFKESGELLAFSVDGTTSPATPVEVKAPAGATLTNLYGEGDSDRPFANLVGDAGTVTRYQASGEFEPFADYLMSDAWIDHLALTPATLYGLDSRPTTDLNGYQAWSRSIAGGVAGTETLLPARASSGGVSASGARMIQSGRSGITLRDRGELVRKLPSTGVVTTVSGAYYTDWGSTSLEMRRVDGTRVLKGVSAIFGSTAIKELSGNRYQVVDVTGAAKTVTGVLPGAVISGLYGAEMWGDWVMVGSEDAVTGDTTTVVFNYRDPSRVYVLPGDPQELGDGFAIIQDNDEGTNVLWKFIEGTHAAIEADQPLSGDLATDGSHRIAYSTDTEIGVRTIAGTGVGATQPLLLGLVAPTSLNNKPVSASWKPQIDTTKALGEGTLTIKDATQAVVRTITVNPAADGSIRDLSWNGRAADDVTPVKPGTYSWELSVPSVDGTGNLARNTEPANLVSGLITGKIKVTSSFLGTVSGPAPKISDMTPVVGQPLTAKPGTWKPSGATTTTYQWLSGGVVTGTNSAAYTVTPADAGKKLQVKITVTADGWKTVTKSSGTTAKVAKATLSPAPVPTIDNTAPVVGNTVTAVPGTWGPDPVALGYQWYRVLAGKRTPIADATTATYEVAAADAGNAVQVAVTGTKDGYNTKTVFSALTTVVPTK